MKIVGDFRKLTEMQNFTVNITGRCVSDCEDVYNVETERGPNKTEIGSSAAIDLAYLASHLNTMRFLVQRVIAPMVICFGIVGNIVNISVLTRRWMKSSTNSYLTALAIYDVLYLSLAFVMSLSHYDGVKDSLWYNRYRHPYVRPLTNTCSNTGVWLTLTFTVERYIGVGYPIKGKIWCTPQRAKVIIGIVCFLAAAVTFPEFFDCVTVERVNSQNKTVVVRNATRFGSSPLYTIGYTNFNQFVFTFIPLVLLMIFNFLLIHAVISAERWRRKMVAKVRDDSSGGDRQNRGQQKITIMLIAVVLVFLFCQTPQAIQHVYVTYADSTKAFTPEQMTILKISANVFNLLVILNCSVNFILYSSFSSKFRMTFQKIFCRSCAKRRERTSKENFYSETTNAGRRIHKCDTVPLCNKLAIPGHPCDQLNLTVRMIDGQASTHLGSSYGSTSAEVLSTCEYNKSNNSIAQVIRMVVINYTVLRAYS